MVSRLMVEGLISSAGTLTPLGQNVFDQLARMALDDTQAILKWLLIVVRDSFCTTIIRRTLQISSWVRSANQTSRMWMVTAKGDEFLREHVVTYINGLEEASLVATAVGYLPLEELPPYIAYTDGKVRQAANMRAVSLKR